MTRTYLLCFAFILASCDNSPFRSGGVEKVDFPAIENFDRVIVVDQYRPETYHTISSSREVHALREFLEAYRSDWFMPTHGTYVNEAALELYAGVVLVETIFVGSDYLARDSEGIYVRWVSEEEVISLENLLGYRLRSVGHP